SYRVLDDGEAPPDGCRAFRCRWAAQGFEWPSMEEMEPEIELGPEATEEDVAYHLCYDPRLAAALSQPGETVLLDDYDRDRGATSAPRQLDGGEHSGQLVAGLQPEDRVGEDR